MSTDRPRTLADQLRRWPAERVAALLDARPDLALPAPSDSAQLAARAVVRSSVSRALDGLDRGALEVLQALAQEGPTDAVRLAELTGEPPAWVEQTLEQLIGLALAWGPSDAVAATGMVAELLAMPPGPPPGHVAALIAGLDDRARRLLEHLDEADALGTVSAASMTGDTPVRTLLDLDLLVRRDDRHVQIPWTVRCFLRGGRSVRGPIADLPGWALGERSQSLIDRAAAGAAFEFVRRTETLLEQWGHRPPGALRGGGLGVRELRAAALAIHAEPAEAALILETAVAARLLAVGMTDEVDAAWLPTDDFDVWLGLSSAQRWLVLVQAWLDSPRQISLIGGRDGDKPINALTPGLERPWLPADRQALIAELATMPAGATLASGTGMAALIERLRWRAPRRATRRPELLGPLWSEAAQLGLVALDGVASPTRVLTEGDAAVALEALLPAPVDHVLVQADLTAIAPGPLEPSLAKNLALLAEIESSGGATVYRFAVDSLRRGFDAGWTAAEIKDFLARSSRTPIPQALDFLVDDVARRFGVLRLGAVESFLRSEDETALTELLHHPGAAALRLRRIAPTVVVSDIPAATLLGKLREIGAAPVLEAADGSVQVLRPTEYRARAPRREPVAAQQVARQAARTAAVVAAIQAGDKVSAQRPSRGPATSPSAVIDLLRAAIAEERSVLIGYLDSHGGATDRLVRPVEVGGGRLAAFDERAGEAREFSVHRISRASLADADA